MRGLGISALFAGESGTGKTMAAEVLAKELHLDLYRIDLSGVVSKYIGETERNLRRVFDAAETSGAMLLFDEADALFGKRSEVRDSHDRYANIEVSYLLQRMEAYRGLAVLTTNMKAALDVAFSRRLSFVVQFPFPDQHQRELIWRRIFPAATPVEPLDYAKLARLSMSGGNIRSIALNAAFLAADEGAAVGMRHLLQAAHTEAAKRERPLSDAETRGGYEEGRREYRSPRAGRRSLRRPACHRAGAAGAADTIACGSPHGGADRRHRQHVASPPRPGPGDRRYPGSADRPGYGRAIADHWSQGSREKRPGTSDPETGQGRSSR